MTLLLPDRQGLVTGTVDDVRPSIAEAAVYVVPLRAGGGTRLKIFEALAMANATSSRRHYSWPKVAREFEDDVKRW